MTAVASVSDLRKSSTGIELVDTSGHSGKSACSSRLNVARSLSKTNDQFDFGMPHGVQALLFGQSVGFCCSI
jgi:hypothetical protein